VIENRVRAILALLVVPGVTRRDCYRVSAPLEDLYEMLQTGPGREQIADELDKHVPCPDWVLLDAQLEAIKRTSVSVMTAWDTDYPDALRYVSDSPPLLFYKGDSSQLSKKGVAIVGTRKPTPGGIALSRRLARDLSTSGVVVVSGMARGIDSAAHEGSMKGDAGTVAVLGTGLDVPYPPENAGLMLDIARHGCVVSEQWMGTPPSRHVFPMRNRLISGLSSAVVVVEGGLKSGALITARWALEQGQDVGAVPGFPGDFRSDGPNQLLRQGAFMVESAADVFMHVPGIARAITLPGELFATPNKIVGDSTAADLFAAIGKNAVDAGSLADMLEIQIDEVQRTLTRMEIEGLITRDDAGRYCREAGS